MICYYSKYHQRQVNVTSGDRGLPVAELNSILPASFLGNFLYGKGSLLMGILSKFSLPKQLLQHQYKSSFNCCSLKTHWDFMRKTGHSSRASPFKTIKATGTKYRTFNALWHLILQCGSAATVSMVNTFLYPAGLCKAQRPHKVRNKI